MEMHVFFADFLQAYDCVGGGWLLWLGKTPNHQGKHTEF